MSHRIKKLCDNILSRKPFTFELLLLVAMGIYAVISHLRERGRRAGIPPPEAVQRRSNRVLRRMKMTGKAPINSGRYLRTQTEIGPMIDRHKRVAKTLPRTYGTRDDCDSFHHRTPISEYDGCGEVSEVPYVQRKAYP